MLDSYHVMRPIYELTTHSKVVFKWTPECHPVLEKVKALVKAVLKLAHFDPNDEIIIECDAFNRGISGMRDEIYLETMYTLSTE
jgi:hypothetical protein